jgi:hypothetical protein
MSDKRNIPEVDKYGCEGARRLAAFKLLIKLSRAALQPEQETA